MKEKAYYLHYKDNANSWGRMMMLFNLYWPGFKLGFIIYVLYPFIAYLVAIIAKKYTNISLRPLLEAPIFILLFTSPIILTKRDYRDISAQLPITTMEKFGFLLITFLIGVPLTMNLSLNFSQILCKAVFDTRIPVEIFNWNKQGDELLPFYIRLIGSYIIFGAFFSVVLYYVVTAKNRTLAAFMSFFLLFLFLMFSGAIIGLVGAFFVGTLFVEEDTLIESSAFMIWSTSFLLVLYLTLGIIYLFKLYKYLHNHGF